MDNWELEVKKSLFSPKMLKSYVNISSQQLENAILTVNSFPFAVTDYYARLMQSDNPDCPIQKQIIPSIEELDRHPGEINDPLCEELDSPVACVTIRYPGTALLLVTNSCFSYCRHCNRRRRVGNSLQLITREMIFSAIDYIKGQESIHDVLISGGDPLTLADQELDEILFLLRKIKHIRTIRIGTRAPVVLPSRITPSLVKILRKYSPLLVNTHFNHPVEITDSSKKALEIMVDGGIMVGNQTVLLRGINDCAYILKQLFLELVENRVRPYYLFQCDLAIGLGHFRTSISRGLEIMESLIGHIPGFAVPTYAVDAPGGAGKIPLTPNYLITHAHNKVILRNFEGIITAYPQSISAYDECPPGCKLCGEIYSGGNRKNSDKGVAGLLNSEAESIFPHNLDRIARHKKEK